MTNGYWWCAECHEEVDCHRVTSQEVHDTCGRPVVWVEPQDPVNLLRDQLAALQAENEELLTQHRTEHCEAAGYDCEELAGLKVALSRVEAERDAARQDCAVAEENHCKAVACIQEVEEAVRFQRPSAIVVAISKWRSAQGEG